MYDLKSISASEIAECASALRGMGSGAGSMEEAANKIVGYLYDNLGDTGTSQKSCALVRFYKTHPYGELEAGLQEFASALLGSAPPPATPCLTLLGTIGDNAQWSSRANSQGHKAIPLASAEGVGRIP